MDKSKKIMIAVIAVLGVICVAAVGILIGSHMNQSAPAAEPAATEAITQAPFEPASTEWMQVYTEPATEAYEPDEIATAAPTTTQAPTTTWTYTTKAPTTKAPTTKAPTTKAPTTTQAPTTRTTTQAPTTRATTQATTTRPTTTQATTANRNGPFALIVNSDNGGYEVSGGGRYSSGEFVKVSMTPRVGYKFVRWESSDTKVLPNSTSQTYVFQMPTSGVSLHAVTQAQTLLTVNKGKGISSVSGGGYYTPGDKVTITAQLETGYEFAGWTSSSAGTVSNSQSFTFTMPNKPTTMTANAKAKGYSLTVTAGSGVRSVTGSGRYNAGDKVTLYVYVNDGYTLNHFSNLNANYNGNTVTFNMPAKDLSLTATAKAQGYSLRVTAGNGVRSVSGDGRYNAGDKVTLYIAMYDGYTLNQWSNLNASYNGNTVTFYMPARDLSLTATGKSANKHMVTVTLGEGVRDVQGTGKYAPGETVTLTCTLDSGYKFAQWESSNIQYVRSSTARTFTFKMPDADVSFIARTEKEEEEVEYLVGIELGEGIYSVDGSGYYKPGDRVTVDCRLEDGYSFSSWTIRYPTSVDEVSTKRYTFTMPRGDVMLKANGRENQETPIF